MKKHLILIGVALLATISVGFAQSQSDKRENIEAFRIAYFTRIIGLSSEEAKTFWPIYNEMQLEQEKVRKERRNRTFNAKESIETMTDKELEKLVDDEINSRQRELDIEKKYHEKFKSILPINKVVKYYRAEEGFKRELVKRLQEQRK